MTSFGGFVLSGAARASTARLCILPPISARRRLDRVLNRSAATALAGDAAAARPPLTKQRERVFNGLKHARELRPRRPPQNAVVDGVVFPSDRLPKSNSRRGVVRRMGRNRTQLNYTAAARSNGGLSPAAPPATRFVIIPGHFKICHKQRPGRHQ